MHTFNPTYFFQGPVGVGYTCYCAPFFRNVESKLEKDKVALMDHIDAAHDKLDAKITNLEHRTRSHIQHLSDTVKQKVSTVVRHCQISQHKKHLDV